MKCEQSLSTLFLLMLLYPFIMIWEVLQPILEALNHCFDPLRVFLVSVIEQLYQVKLI